MALILKRASASRTSGEWNDDDYDVLADGVVVGRIMKAAAAPQGKPWLWTGSRSLILSAEWLGDDDAYALERAANPLH
jgi:hypothetical protein